MKLPKAPLREVITIDGVNVDLEVKDNPVVNLGVLKAKELFHYLNIFDPKFKPSNYNKADGTPLRLFDSPTLKIDVSKRSKEDMGFWHRNIDYNEVIMCARRAAVGNRNGCGHLERGRCYRHSERNFASLNAVRGVDRGKRADRTQVH
jgi:hypothetical protein